MFKRPLVIAIISYIIGIIWGIYVKSIFLFFALQLISIIVFLSVRYIKNVSIIRLIKQKIEMYVYIIFIVFSVLGFMHLKNKEDKIEKMYSINNFNITIISDAINEEYSNKYIVAIDNCNVKAYLIVNKNTEFEYGDYLKICGEIEEPDGQRNSYGFDYKMYMKSINIVGNIREYKYNYLKKNNVNTFNKCIKDIKKNIKRNIYVMLKTDSKYLLEAFLLGDREMLSDDINDNFAKSSLSHLLAISGTHITIIMILVTKILRYIKIGKRKSYYILIIVLYMYIFIAGQTASVTRVCIVTIISIFSKIVYRKSDIYNNISLSAMIILSSNPFNIINLSFILSYGGIIGILLYDAISKKDKIKGKFLANMKNSILISISIEIVILPILINKFNVFSLVFLISNLIAIPLLTVIINIGVIGIIISFIYMPIAILIGNLINIMMNALILISKICATIPFSENYFIRIDMYLIIIYYSILIYIAYLIKINRGHYIKHYIKKYYKCILCIIAICSILFNLYNCIGIRNLEIHFIDVGQGDATLIRTTCNINILIDGGGKSETSKFDVGKNTLLPYILNNKVAKLDYAIISHFDSDHVRTAYLLY